MWKKFVVICNLALFFPCPGYLLWAQPISPKPAEKGPVEEKRVGSESQVGPRIGDADEGPWSDGVPLSTRKIARELFEEGNALFESYRPGEAILKYREALGHWEHPAIHFNLAVALLDQQEIVRAYSVLELALRYGPEPLGQEAYTLAQRKISQLTRQLGTIEIVCREPDARVSLNGQEALRCPGDYRELAAVGEYSITATKDGLIPGTWDIALSPRETEHIDVILYDASDMTFTRRNWPSWIPWSVAGIGLSVLFAGGGLHAQSRSEFASFDQDFSTICEDGGCLLDEVPQLTDRLDTARNRQRFAVGCYAAGGAILATGLIMAYMNRPRVFRHDAPNVEFGSVYLTPSLDASEIELMAEIRF